MSKLPFKITNPEDIPPGVAWTITKDELKAIEKQNDALIEIRGRVISAALLIEQKVDDIISSVLFGQNNQLCLLFKEMFLEKEFFSFMNKWKVLREITQRKIINFEDEQLRKNLFAMLKEIIDTRDRFAHGDIVFSGTRPQLHFLEDGQRKFFQLDNTFFGKANETFSSVLILLENIYQFTRGELPYQKEDDLKDGKKDDENNK